MNSYFSLKFPILYKYLNCVSQIYQTNFTLYSFSHEHIKNQLTKFFQIVLYFFPEYAVVTFLHFGKDIHYSTDAWLKLPLECVLKQQYQLF